MARMRGASRLTFAVPMWVSHELLARLEARFLPSYWARGAEYHRDGRVTLVSVHDKEVRAQVRGSGRKPYLVALEQRAGDMAVDGFCSCPVGFRCKHISAVLQRLGEESAAVRGERAEAPATRDPKAGRGLEDPAEPATTPAPSTSKVEPSTAIEVAYLLETGARAGAAPRVLAYLVRRDVELGLEVVGRARFDLRRGRAAAAAGPEDRQLWQRLLELDQAQDELGRRDDRIALSGTAGSQLFVDLVKTGRAWWTDFSQPLRYGPERGAVLHWDLGVDGVQTLALELDGGAGEDGRWLGTKTPHYLRERASDELAPQLEVGPVRLHGATTVGAGLDADLAWRLTPGEAESLGALGRSAYAEAGLPIPRTIAWKGSLRPGVVLRVRSLGEAEGALGLVSDRLEICFDYGGRLLERDGSPKGEEIGRAHV